MQNIPNRRERRAAMKYQGMLKAKSKLPFKILMYIPHKRDCT